MLTLDNANHQIDEWATETAIINGYIKIMQIKQVKVCEFLALEEKFFSNNMLTKQQIQLLFDRKPIETGENSKVVVKGEIMCVLVYLIAKKVECIEKMSIGVFELTVVCNYWGENLTKEVDFDGKQDVHEDAGKFYPVILSRELDQVE